MKSAYRSALYIDLLIEILRIYDIIKIIISIYDHLSYGFGIYLRIDLYQSAYI